MSEMGTALYAICTPATAEGTCLIDRTKHAELL